jgi:Domain of unknown function (DUF4265)
VRASVAVKGSRRSYKEMSFVRIALKVDNLPINREVVIAVPTTDQQYILRSIPAYVYGTAYGDEIKLLDKDTGAFQVLKRGGHVTLRVFVPGALDRKEIDELIEMVTNVGGIHEIAKNAMDDDLLSIPVSVGFPKIEKIMLSVTPIQAKWEYGNVYSEHGALMNWWKDEA